jgi:hypothetical protein
MTATTTPDDAMEDARPSRDRGARVAELRASFESALRACAEPPTAQVGGRETTRWFPRTRRARGRGKETREASRRREASERRETMED